MSAPLALAVRDLRVAYGARSAAGRVEAVRGVDLELARGRTLALVGESGSGKSATGLAIMGLLPRGADVQGSVRLGDTELLGLPDAAMSRHRGADLGMVFQDPAGALNPVQPIGRQVDEALLVHGRAGRSPAPGMSRRAARERTLELLALVGFDTPRRVREAYAHELSGGQRQRVAIAIAVANAPAVVIADEPTTALDTCVQAQVLQVLRRATGQLGAALLLITHDLAVVAGLADDVAVIADGRIVETAPADRLYAAPEHPATRQLLEATPRIDEPGPSRRVGSPTDRPLLEVTGVRVSIEGRRRGSLVGSLLGRGRHDPRPGRGGLDGLGGRVGNEGPDRSVGRAGRGGRQGSGERVEHPWRRRRQELERIVDDVDFEVYAGECLAIVGESGAGKSSTLRAVMDLDPRRDDAPEVWVDGVPIRKAADVRSRLHPAVQLVFQDSGDALDPRLSVAELVGEPLTVTGMPRAERSARVLDLLGRVGLAAEVADRFSAQLSGGQRQRVAIARGLATTPRVLLLDEPVSALDVRVQADLLDLLARLQAELALGYVVVAHDLAVVRRIADRISVMFAGRIVETGPAEAVLGEPRHPYTRALVSSVPIPDPARERARRAIPLADPGAPGSAADEANRGCPVASRCPLRPLLPEDAQAVCRTERPLLDAVPSASSPPSASAALAVDVRRVACHHADRAVTLLPIGSWPGTSGAAGAAQTPRIG